MPTRESAIPGASLIATLASTALHVPTRNYYLSSLSRGEPFMSFRRTNRPSGRPEMGSAFFAHVVVASSSLPGTGALAGNDTP